MTSATARKTDDAAAAETLSPAMSQWWATKRAHPECLVFFRMGDFYEMFFDDAVKAAGALDIALTRRGTHKGEPVPMAGVPVHAADQYLSRLIRKGFRVAICDQMEDPAAAKKRGPKAVVRREVTRVVTPGTLTEDGLLDARRHNHLAALAEAQGTLALAWLDMSTGAVWLQPLGGGGGGGGGGDRGAGSDAVALAAALARVAPGELLVSERLIKQPALFEVFGDHRDVLTPLPDSRFDSTNGRRRLQDPLRRRRAGRVRIADTGRGRGRRRSRRLCRADAGRPPAAARPATAPAAAGQYRGGAGDRPGNAAQSGAAADARR